VVQNIFFLTQNNQNWMGIGYKVIPDLTNTTAGLVGTLYRFETNHNNYTATNISGEFLRAQPVGMNRIADGVVHLRLRAFATNGFPILWDGIRTNGMFRTNIYTTGSFRLGNVIANNPLIGVFDQTDYY